MIEYWLKNDYIVNFQITYVKLLNVIRCNG
jgi:hypothetical protein